MLQITCRGTGFHSGVAENSGVPGHDAVTGSRYAWTALLDPYRHINQLLQNAADNTASHPSKTVEATTLDLISDSPQTHQLSGFPD
jgi:hypothetical protein